MSNKVSIRTLLDSKVLKRTDSGLWIQPGALRILPGFNLRDERAEGYKEDMEALTAFILGGGKVPAIEFTLPEDGYMGVDVVDGHRRTAAYLGAIKRGAPIEWIRVDQFTGNDVERTARIMTSNEGRKLTQLEVGQGYARLQAFGLQPEEIAAKVNKTRQHVEQMLILANAPHAVKEMVRKGEVAATTAMKEVRSNGGKEATKRLQEQVATSGGKRVTPKTLKEWAPPTKVVAPVLLGVESLLGSVPTADRLIVENAEKTPDAMVQVNAQELLFLFRRYNELTDEKAKAEQKARDKAAKAAQQSLPTDEKAKA